MKKILVFAMIAMVASAAMAQNWGLFFDDRSDITIGGTSSAVWSEVDGGNMFGTVATPMDYGIVSSLILSDFNIFTWKNTGNGGDVTGGTFNYSIDGGAFTPVALTFIADVGTGGDQNWGISGATIDLANGLGAGDHTFAFYTEVTGSDDPVGPLYDSDSGGNFNGTFEVQAVPEPATMSLLGLGALAMVLRRKIRK